MGVTPNRMFRVRCFMAELMVFSGFVVFSDSEVEYVADDAECFRGVAGSEVECIVGGVECFRGVVGSEVECVLGCVEYCGVVAS